MHDSTPTKSTAKTCIIGAGISGLAHAWELKRRNQECIVLEKSEQPGGAIHSHRIDHYIAEEGPHSIQASSQEVKDFINSIPDLQSSVIEANPEAKNRFIVRAGKLHAVPPTPLSMYKSKLWSFKCKLRALKEWFIKPALADSEESVADFARRRLGDELYNYGINPMVAGIHAGDPEKLSLLHAFPKLYKLEQEQGGLLRGIKQKGRKTKGHILSFENGMGELPEKLASALGKCLHTSVSIKTIRKSDEGWTIVWSDSEDNERTDSFEQLILAVPAHQLLNLPFDSAIRDIMIGFRDIEYTPVSVLSMGFKRTEIEHPLDGFGFLVPECERSKILGVLFPSSTFPKRAYEDEVLLAAFLGGTRNPELAAKETETLKAIVLHELEKLLGLHGQPTFLHHKYWKRGIPQYTLGYGKQLKKMEQLEMNYPGLKLAGNYRTGVSVTACIEAALSYSGDPTFLKI